MTNREKKDIVASVKARLLTISRARRRPFQEVLQYYGMERFLYPLAQSRYKDQFILKGALLLKVWNIADSRATLDIDALAMTSNALENLENILRHICALKPVVEDGVSFFGESIKSQVMQSHRPYDGARMRFEGRLGLARIPMQVDVGFGDVITPAPQQVDYPVLLDFPSPHLKSYPLETVVAEKIQTIVEKGEANSRIKDFYDVWLLLKWSDFPIEGLQMAMERTFEQRKTEFHMDIIKAALANFARLPEAEVLWERFKQKGLPHQSEVLSLTQLTDEITAQLEQIGFAST